MNSTRRSLSLRRAVAKFLLAQAAGCWEYSVSFWEHGTVTFQSPSWQNLL